jgi:predicted nucleotidyltransferase component of viral defense system
LITDKEKLKDIISAIAGKTKFRPGIVEKDYYLTLILNSIESLLSDKLIFKGGTLLNKIHLNYHRLSEDLDFTYFGEEILKTRAQRSRAIDPIRAKMPAFLKALGLASNDPRGAGFNESTQYVFHLNYPSLITAKDETIKFEISLRQFPLEKPVHNHIKHFYQDPFTGKDIFPSGKILSLSFNEAVAEKLKAAINREEVAIRDFYDLWHIAEAGFDFHNKGFIKLFKRKLSDEGYAGDFRRDFGLAKDKIDLLHRQIETDLIPVIRVDEKFELAGVFERFNKILGDIE